MVLKAPLMYTKNPDVVNKALSSGAFVVSLEEGNSMFPIEKIQNMTKGTVLLPPDELNLMVIDGMGNEFVKNYYAYLNIPVVTEFITLLLYMSYSGIPVMLFDTEKDFGYYVEPLLGFFYSFGFVTGLDNRPPVIEARPDKDCHILSLLYIANLIDINTFMAEVPDGNGMEGFLLMAAINKAISEMGIVLDYTTMGMYSYDEINAYNHKLFVQILHDTRHKIVPFIIEEGMM